MFKTKQPDIIKAQQKQLYQKNKQLIIDANHSVDQLLSVLINNFADEFNAFNPKLIEEIKNAKQHMQNLTFLIKKM